MRLKGKLAVVTAAASGMGRAGCEIFAREGAKIAAVDIDQGRLDEVVEVVPHMRARGGGAIMFTASIAGLVGSMLMPVYSAAKFAVVGLTKSLAQTLAPDNIRVNVVCPGLTDTPMLPRFMSRGGGNIEESKKRYLAGVPMARVWAGPRRWPMPRCGWRPTRRPTSPALPFSLTVVIRRSNALCAQALNRAFI